MARNSIVFALCFVAIIGLVSAADPVPAAGAAVANATAAVANATSNITGTATAPAGEDAAAPGAAAAGPDGASGTAPVPSPNSGNALKVSAIGGIAAVTAAAFFF
ncbi:hypothetical protein ACFE04_007590 [Oxalis oulophora]